MADTQTKRGGARPGAGQPRKPPDQAVSVRVGLALTPAEAEELRSLGGSKWIRGQIQASIAKASQE